MMEDQTIQATSGQQPISATSGPTVFVMVDNAKKETSFAKKSAIGLSIVQIILGIASFLAQTVILILLSTNGGDYDDYAGGIGEGIYCGIFFIITGGLGILSSRKPTMCCISAFMTLSIISSILSGILIILASIKLAIVNGRWSWQVDVGDREVRMVMLSMMVLAGVVEMIVAIVCAAICCGACCCPGNGSSAGRVVYLAQRENGSGMGPVQVAGSVPVQMTGGVPVQMAFASQANPVTGVLDQTLNELPSYGDVVRGEEQETKEKYGKGGYMRFEN